ncbi:hypothetical protein D3C77_662820 [compost metagenome]
MGPERRENVLVDPALYAEQLRAWGTDVAVAIGAVADVGFLEPEHRVGFCVIRPADCPVQERVGDACQVGQMLEGKDGRTTLMHLGGDIHRVLQNVLRNAGGTSCF